MVRWGRLVTDQQPQKIIQTAGGGLAVHFRPDDVSAKQLYDAMTAIITPRPIAWVSTLSSGGTANLAPYSFFNGVGIHPPTIVFCPVNRPDGTPKDTLRNIRETGQFVVNLVQSPHFDAMKMTSADVNADEFELAGLSQAPSVVVDVPRVAGVGAAIECELHSAIQLAAGPSAANLVIGRIVAIYADDSLLDDEGQIDSSRVDTLGRMGGKAYTRTGDRIF